MNKENRTSGDKIVFLGTGAADWPEHLSDMEKQNAGQNSRRYSSVLVNNHLLIDCGPTVPEALATFGLDRLNITDVLLTHSHRDHLSPDVLRSLARSNSGNALLNIWGHKAALAFISGVDGISLHPVSAGMWFCISDMRIQALAANHPVAGSREKALHYFFKGRRQWLYATDGAWLLKPAFESLQKAKLDAVVWDATIGDIEGDYRIFEHNSLAMIRLMTASLKRQEIVKQDAKVILTHMARTLYPEHEEMEGSLLSEGLIPAYDGMGIEV